MYFMVGTKTSSISQTQRIVTLHMLLYNAYLKALVNIDFVHIFLLVVTLP